MPSTRREFLTTSLGATAVVSCGGTVPRFLLEAAAAEGEAPGETIVVVVQLSGGNDGLNTIVPYADDRYRRARPTLAIPRGDILKIDKAAGFHPALRGFADLLEAGRLAIVQGVGYPDPNRSHFESMDVWHSCRRKTEPRQEGWLGRYLDATRADGGDLPALHVGGKKQPLALAARDVRVPTVRSLERFRLRDGDSRRLQEAIEQLSAGGRSEGDELLGFVQASTASALRASRRVGEAGRDYRSEIAYPASGLAERLRTVAQLIDAGLGTRVYYVELDGFDTHARQGAAHGALLEELAGAVAAFIGDIVAHGHGERVLLMGFSEFGRRVQENASEGTDHGAAAPMFVAGTRVRAGLVGAQPSLDDLAGGDLKFHTDFRQVYATLLENWLGWKSGPVLGGEFETLPLIEA